MAGIPGLLGLLWPITGNPGMAGFFGFFGFFAWFRLQDDERLQANLGRAAINAFFVAVVVFAVATLAAAFLHAEAATVYAVGLAVSFGLQMATFAVSLVVFENAAVPA